MSSKISKEMADAVIERDKRRCQMCMLYFPAHRVVYVVPRDPNKSLKDEKNLVTVCSTCELTIPKSGKGV